MFNFFTNNKKPKIQFWTELPELENKKELYPQPASKFFPTWLKTIPKYTLANDIFQESRKTIKTCPAVIDTVITGYIVPMWCDSYLFSTQDTHRWETAIDKFKWDVHPPDQFMNYIPKTGSDYSPVAFKPHVPWKIRTPKGYSIMILHPFYHFKNDYTVLPGIVDTDKYFSPNFPILLNKKDNPVLIKKGDPFVWIFPFKRDKFKYTIEKNSSKLTKMILDQDLDVNWTFSNGYRKLTYKK